jgi:hypothetical protein
MPTSRLPTIIVRFSRAKHLIGADFERYCGTSLRIALVFYCCWRSGSLVLRSPRRFSCYWRRSFLEPSSFAYGETNEPQDFWLEGEGRFDLKRLVGFFQSNDGCLFTTDIAPGPDSFVRVMGYVSDPLVVVQITIFVERVEAEQPRATRISSPSRN